MQLPFAVVVGSVLRFFAWAVIGVCAACFRISISAPPMAKDETKGNVMGGALEVHFPFTFFLPGWGRYYHHRRALEK